MPPFNGDDDEAIMESVKKGVLSFDSDEWRSVSLEAKRLIIRMLERDPRKRISAE